MSQSIYRILHAYHPDPNEALAICHVLIYRSSLILIGYARTDQPFSAFVHYQFSELNIPDVYNTQIQMIQSSIPDAFLKASQQIVFHAEPNFVLMPKSEAQDISIIKTYHELISKSTEKVLKAELLSGSILESYNYPYRVYNDSVNAFERAEFRSYHGPLFDQFATKSLGKHLVYTSVKTQNIEIIAFYNGHLIFDNTFEYRTKADMMYYLKATTQDLGIAADHQHIYATTVRKEESKDILDTIRQQFPNLNSKVKETFGCQPQFWELYADAFLLLS